MGEPSKGGRDWAEQRSGSIVLRPHYPPHVISPLIPRPPVFRARPLQAEKEKGRGNAFMARESEPAVPVRRAAKELRNHSMAQRTGKDDADVPTCGSRGPNRHPKIEGQIVE